MYTARITTLEQRTTHKENTERVNSSMQLFDFIKDMDNQKAVIEYVSRLDARSICDFFNTALWKTCAFLMPRFSFQIRISTYPCDCVTLILKDDAESLSFFIVDVPKHENMAFGVCSGPAFNSSTEEFIFAEELANASSNYTFADVMSSMASACIDHLKSSASFKQDSDAALRTCVACGVVPDHMYKTISGILGMPNRDLLLIPSKVINE